MELLPRNAFQERCNMHLEEFRLPMLSVLLSLLPKKSQRAKLSSTPVVPQPPCSPDLTSCDLFCSLYEREMYWEFKRKLQRSWKVCLWKLFWDLSLWMDRINKCIVRDWRFLCSWKTERTLDLEVEELDATSGQACVIKGLPWKPIQLETSRIFDASSKAFCGVKRSGFGTWWNLFILLLNWLRTNQSRRSPQFHPFPPDDENSQNLGKTFPQLTRC